MANVKISLLPAENDVSNILGFAGYNAAGTCKISGADLINTLPVVSMQQVFTNSIPNVTATDTSKKLDLSLGEIELEATQTGGGNSVATMTSADGGGAVKVQLSLDSAAGSAGAGQGALIASGTALLGSLDFTHVYAVDNDVTLSAGTNTLGGNTSNYLNMPAGINIVGGGPGTDIGQIELTAWKADVAVPVVNCGIKLNGALGDIAFNGDGLGTPAPNDVLTAKNASGEVEWTTPSTVVDTFQTTAVFRNLFDAGSPITGTGDIAQFGYVSTEDNPSLYLVTRDCQLVSIGFKWLGGSTTSGIDPGDSWEIFAYPLTSANLNADSSASYGAGTTTGLVLDNTDNGTYPGKFNTLGTPITMTAGEMWAFAAVETGIIGSQTAEAIIWLNFEAT